MSFLPHFVMVFAFIGWWAAIAGGTVLVVDDPEWEEREVWIPAVFLLFGGDVLLVLAQFIN